MGYQSPAHQGFKTDAKAKCPFPNNSSAADEFYAGRAWAAQGKAWAEYRGV